CGGGDCRCAAGNGVAAHRRGSDVSRGRACQEPGGGCLGGARGARRLPGEPGGSRPRGRGTPRASPPAARQLPHPHVVGGSEPRVPACPPAGSPRTAGRRREPARLRGRRARGAPRGVGVESRLFDQTPLALVTRVVTEEASLTAAGVRRRLARRPVAAWWRTLSA